MSDEFQLIRRFFADLTPPGADVVRGIGDDCALLRPPAGRDLAVSIDTLVEGVHFPADAKAADIGWKALACGLSDLAAAGAVPAWALLSITRPDANEDWLAGFAGGFGRLARAHGLALVGGDMSRGPVSITVQIAGHVPSGAGLTRGGARPGDGIFVSGTPGRAAAGLARHLAGAGAPDDPLAVALHRPEPRVALGRRLHRAGASACVDVSDGLAADLGHILDASGVGGELWAEALPCAGALAGAGDAAQVRRWILHGGDDYELCFTADAGLDIERLGADAGVPVARIGRVTAAAGLRLVESDGTSSELEHGGYRHFG